MFVSISFLRYLFPTPGGADDLLQQSNHQALLFSLKRGGKTKLSHPKQRTVFLNLGGMWIWIWKALEQLFVVLFVQGMFSPNMPAGGVMRSNVAKMYRKLTLKVQGGTVINKEAWSYKLTTPLCTSCPSVFTHPLKKRGHQRTLGECLPSRHSEVVKKVTVTLEAAFMVEDRWFQLPRLHFTAGCSLAGGMETSRNLYRKFWTQRRMYWPGSSTSGPC